MNTQFKNTIDVITQKFLMGLILGSISSLILLYTPLGSHIDRCFVAALDRLPECHDTDCPHHHRTK